MPNPLELQDVPAENIRATIAGRAALAGAVGGDRPLGGGRQGSAQGSAHLARRADGSDPTPRFLKVLKAQERPR